MANLTGNVTGNVAAGAGSAASPSVTFGDADTGVYGPTAGEIGFTLNGTEFLRLSSLALSYSSGSNNVSLSNDGVIEITKNGGGAYIDFKSAVGEDADARIFEISNGIGFQTGGNGTTATRMVITSAGQIQSVGSGTASAPAYSFSGDTNTGIFSPGADQLAASVNGAEALRIIANGNVGISTSAQINKLDIASAGTSQITVKDGIDNLARYDFGRDGTDGFFAFNGVQATFSGYRWAVNNGTEAMRITNAGNLHFNSGYGSAALAFGCRAWVNFNGTGTVAIRASGNVSSITDNGTGDYTVNFTTNMPDANYAPMVVIEQSGVAGGSATEAASISSQTTSSVRFACKYSYSIFSAGATSNRYDPNTVSVTITR